MDGMGQDTCVGGEEWLRSYFDPALRRKPPYEQLRTELSALAESGVLSEGQASRARARVDEDEHGQHATTRRRQERKPYVNNVRVGDRLVGELTPEQSLGEVDGITVVVMLVELWTSRLILRLEAVPNQLTAALDAAFDSEWKAWEARWVEDRAAAEAEDVPAPREPSISRLGGLPLSVADDVGARYYFAGGATGGSEHPWRSEWCLEPAVPLSASVLRIALEDRAPDREWVELAQPPRT